MADFDLTQWGLSIAASQGDDPNSPETQQEVAQIVNLARSQMPGASDAEIAKTIQEGIGRVAPQLKKAGYQVPDVEQLRSTLQTDYGVDALKQAQAKFQEQKQASGPWETLRGTFAAQDPQAYRQYLAGKEGRETKMKEETVGQFEKERATVKDELKTIMEGETWETQVKQAQMKLKQEQDANDPNSAVSKAAQATVEAMMQTYPKIKEVFGARGIDPLGMSAADLQKIVPNLDKVVDNTRKQLEAQMKQEMLEAKNALKQREIEMREATAGARIAQKEAELEAKKAAAATKPTEGEKVFAREEAKEAAKFLATVESDKANIQDKLERIGKMKTLTKDVAMGPVAGKAGTAAKYVPFMGQKEQEYDLLASEMELTSAADFLKGQGAITEGERAILRAAIPTREVDNAVARKALEAKEQILKRGMQRLEAKEQEARRLRSTLKREEPTQPKVVDFGDL